MDNPIGPFGLASLLRLCHLKLAVNLLLQFIDMGNDAYQPLGAGQIMKDPDVLYTACIVQRPQALVHEHRIQADGAGCALHDVRKPQGHCQGRQKRLAAG